MTTMSEFCFTGYFICGSLSRLLFFNNTFVCRDEEEEDDDDEDDEEEEEDDEESPVKACLFFGSSVVCIQCVFSLIFFCHSRPKQHRPNRNLQLRMGRV